MHNTNAYSFGSQCFARVLSGMRLLAFPKRPLAVDPAVILPVVTPPVVSLIMDRDRRVG